MSDKPQSSSNTVEKNGDSSPVVAVKPVALPNAWARPFVPILKNEPVVATTVSAANNAPNVTAKSVNVVLF